MVTQPFAQLGRASFREHTPVRRHPLTQNVSFLPFLPVDNICCSLSKAMLNRSCSVYYSLSTGLPTIFFSTAASCCLSPVPLVSSLAGYWSFYPMLDLQCRHAALSSWCHCWPTARLRCFPSLHIAQPRSPRQSAWWLPLAWATWWQLLAYPSRQCLSWVPWFVVHREVFQGGLS